MDKIFALAAAEDAADESVAAIDLDELIFEEVIDEERSVFTAE
eukprot:CAMPEP_0170470306 /NCGR_PEP_ID=MMETSP0123-20130129/12805_1 /TAXON_ID=182087 /ORGANISM="Favella ehrenbergii, Strain Fehren 1" /LENGTH=42 /DNA_ID= /DNA_START= /DNA_END= /DNA_ORIENTATION=